MIKFFLLLMLACTSVVKAQEHYTKLRAAVGFEALGLAPVGTIATDMPFSYRSKGFWNAQFGIGITQSINSRLTFSNSDIVTYNFLLNPYFRSLCSPAPDYNRLEYYVESGLGLAFFDPHHDALPDRLKSRSWLSTAALCGIRIHYVGERWIYIFKARFTPFLDRSLQTWGSAGLGVGWR